MPAGAGRGRTAMIIARSPLRISLGGGGTDLPSYYREHGGFLIAATINKFVYVSVQRAYHPGCLLRYSQIERVSRREEIRHPIIREAISLLDVDLDYLEVTSFADLPAGTGLGSSGSFGTALLKAFHRYKCKSITQQQLAEMSCHIEIERLREPVGKQDQYAAAFGGVNCYEFRPDGSVLVSPLSVSERTLKELNENLLLFSTGISRAASDILMTQDARTRQGDAGMVENLHFIKQVGHESRKAFEEGDPSRFGRLMHEHWRKKKKRSPLISSPDIDRWYDLGLENGALGGKIIGAGGGGFLMFYAEDPTRLRKAMAQAGLEELTYSFTYDGTKLLEGGEM